MKAIQIVIALLAISTTILISWMLLHPETDNYPLGLEIRGEVKTDYGVVSLSHRVDFEKDQYVYHYEIKYNGPVVLFAWDVLNKTTETPVLLELYPGCNHKITIKNDSAPTMYNGQITFYQKNDSFDKVPCWQTTEPLSYIGPVPK